MSWLLIGIGGVVILAIIIYSLSPKSDDSRRHFSQAGDEIPPAATRVAEETHHGAHMGVVQGRGLADGVNPFMGTLPKRRTKKKQ
jgi:hypothetical protein